jgi:hypothetical protein
MEQNRNIQNAGELSVVDVENQVVKIQKLMGSVMKKDEHYGTIPGTQKPSLYKAGAEKLCLVFRLAPDFTIERTDLPNNHREYYVVCRLTHIPTGSVLGSGVGSCSTMEGKYRWRKGEGENTGQSLPSGYWDLKKNNSAKAQESIGGKGFYPKKTENGVWVIYKDGGDKVENDNPADQYNTVLKMAKKRALVDATITVTAASDIFTQDVEDFKDLIEEPEVQKTTGNSSYTPPAGPDSSSPEISAKDLKQVLERTSLAKSVEEINKIFRENPSLQSNAEYAAARRKRAEELKKTSTAPVQSSYKSNEVIDVDDAVIDAISDAITIEKPKSPNLEKAMKNLEGAKNSEDLSERHISNVANFREEVADERYIDLHNKLTTNLLPSNK